MNIRRHTFRAALMAPLMLASFAAAQAPAPEATPAPAVVSAPAPEAAPAAAPAAEVAPAPVAAPAPEVAPAPVAAPAPAPLAAPAPQAAAPKAAPKAEAARPMAAPVAEKAAAPKAEAKSEFAIVDVPANFEIQAKRVMAETEESNNLDQWWGRANLMILTQSEGFQGKVHLRMYPGDLRDNKVVTSVDSSGTKSKFVDVFELTEAWAQQKGDLFSFKLGRWDNTTRPGNFYFGGYVDGYYNGFFSTKGSENLAQFGISGNENMSLDVSFISKDANLNTGDLRLYFKFKELTGLEKLNVGIGYRTNLFDEVYDSDVDVTHNVDLSFSVPAGPVRLFAEAAAVGLDNQTGKNGKADKGGTIDASFPVLGGFEFKAGRALDRVVLEAEWCKDRDGDGEDDAKEVLGSLMIQKKLTDRFTLTGGAHSNGASDEIALSARLQGRIN